MLSARELKKAGMDVLILEKGQLGGESSWAGGGILSPLYPWRYADEVNALAIEGHKSYPELAEELIAHGGIDPEYQRCGLLIADMEEQQAAQDWASKWQMQLEVLGSSSEVQAVLPGAAASIERALWMPQIAQLRNPRLVKSVKAHLKALEVPFLENTPVERLEVDNQRISGVVANGKSFHSERVLVAGGAWSADILKGYGSPPQIEPVKGQMVLFKGQPGLVKSMLLAESRYLIPRRDGRVLCGSTIEHTGFDKSTSESVRQSLAESAIQLFPGLAQLTLEHHWAGLRPGSPDGIPTIGAVEGIEGLFVNAGHYRNGVILGLASARKVARVITRR